jgi:hypothetical protein
MGLITTATSSGRACASVYCSMCDDRLNENGGTIRHRRIYIYKQQTTHRDGLGQVVEEDAALLDALEDGGEVVIHEDHVCIFGCVVFING